MKLRPSYFEAVEHLLGLLCTDHRNKEAVQIIEGVECSLRVVKKADTLKNVDGQSESSTSVNESPNLSEASDRPEFEYDTESETVPQGADEIPGSDQPGLGPVDTPFLVAIMVASSL